MFSKRFLQSLPLSARLLFLILISFGLGAVFQFLGVMVVYAQTGVNLMAGDMSLLDTLPEAEGIMARKILLSIVSIGFFVLPPIIYVHNLSTKKWELLRLKTVPKIWFLLGGMAVIVLIQPFVNLLAELNMMIDFSFISSGLEHNLKEMEEAATANQELFLKTENIQGVIINVVLVALIPAFGEELLFRGVIQSIFNRMTKNAHWGIWITAFLFSAWHGQFFTFLPRFALGVVLGYSLLWSGSLWVPILIHFLNNGLAVVGFYIVQSSGEGVEPAPADDGPTMIWTLASTVLLFIIGLGMWQRRSVYVHYLEEDIVLPDFQKPPEEAA